MTNASSSLLKIIQNTDVFKFGDFLTKSGRISPYYLNLGSLYNTRFFNNLVDLWDNNKNLGNFANQYTAKNVEGHSCSMYRLIPNS